MLTTTAKVQIKAIALVFDVDSFVQAITIGIAIANKIKETQSQTLPIEERSEIAKGKTRIDSTIRIAVFLVIDEGALPLSLFSKEAATALNISENAIVVKISMTIERALPELKIPDTILIVWIIMPNRNKNGVAFIIFGEPIWKGVKIITNEDKTNNEGKSEI